MCIYMVKILIGVINNRKARCMLTENNIEQYHLSQCQRRAANIMTF